MSTLLLIACTSKKPDQPQENGTSETAVPTPPAAMTGPQALAPLTAEGWGPLRIGMTLDEVTKALGPDSDPKAVGASEPKSCDEFRPERAPEGLLVMIENGRLSGISLIDKSNIATDRGLRLGDEEAAIAKAYGKGLLKSPHKYQDAPAGYLTWWTKGEKGDWVQDAAARGIRYSLGGDGKIETIQAGGPSIQYVEGCA